MASFSPEFDLEKQVAALSREIAALKKTVSKYGYDTYEDSRDSALDYYSDVAERVAREWPRLRKRAKAQARAWEDTAREHPATTAAVGLVVLGLIAALLFGRR
jgi:ElaB/YqjD/DUF883 family membrane-anchored ribosome-binding protein